MAREHEGGIIVPTGFRIENPSPIDDRLVVGTLGDLTSSVAFPNIYPGILVAVSESDYGLFKWNGNDRTNYDNWSAFSGGSISGLGGDADSSLSAISASFASTSISSSFATTSSLAFSSNLATTASHALNTLLATTSSFAITSSFAVTASHVLNSDGTSIDLSNLTNSTIFDGNRPVSTPQIPGLFNINPYENAYGFFNEDSSSITDFLEAVFYPPNPNLPPKIISNNEVTIPEFRPKDSFVFDIIAQDQRVGNDPTTEDEIVAYRTQSIYGNNNDDFFKIEDPTIGEITCNTIALSSMNAPGGQHSQGDSHQFYYEVEDSRGAYTQETLFIRITPDSKPTFTTDNDPESGLLKIINEYDISGTYITQIEGGDEEGAVTFRTSSNTDNFFNISASNGIIRLTTKSHRSMNTDTTRNAYPLNIEIVDQFDQFTTKTFYIKVDPNKNPIFRDGSSTGNQLGNSIGVGLSSNNSTIGPKKTIFATNFNDPLALQGTPSENDNIKITTGSNVSDNFDDDFEIVFNNEFSSTNSNPTQTPSVTIRQIVPTLNPNLNPTYQLILTASDEHNQSGDWIPYDQGEDGVTFLTVNINITADETPKLNEVTQSFTINERSFDGTAVAPPLLAAFDPDAATSLNPEQPFIDSFQLKGAFFKEGGYSSNNVNTVQLMLDNEISNLTESFFGTGLLDPTINPFESTNNLNINRKSGVFLNSDKINLYEYEVKIGGTLTANGGAPSDTGIVQIRILDHQPDNTFLPNFDPNPFIIESAVIEDFLKVNSDGFSGENAKIEFTSGISHIYEIKSTNDFILTPPPGDEAVFLLNKNISKSIFTSVESAEQSSNPSNINTIELEITASQENFPTTVQKYKYTINIAPNNGPALSVNTTTYSGNQTTVGSIPSNDNILARIDYANPDAEGDLPNFDSFVFDGGGVLKAEHKPESNRYEVKSLFPLDSNTTYPFIASIKDTHGFISSSIQSSITISDAIDSTFNTNSSTPTFTDPTTGFTGPLFFILEKVSPGVDHIVVKESNGRPIGNTQAQLIINYNDPLENLTTNITAITDGNSNIFSITNDGFISAGTGFAAQEYSPGTVKRVDVNYTSNANNTRTEIIFIEVTENQDPTSNINADLFLVSNPNLPSPIGVGTVLFTIEGLNNFINIQNEEGDTIITPTVTITATDGSTITNTVTPGGDGFFVPADFTITTDELIETSTPSNDDYTTTFSSNALASDFKFYLVEGATVGDFVVRETNGISSETNAANIDISYGAAEAQTLNIVFDIADSAGQSSTVNQDISISPPTATLNNFSIVDDPRFDISIHGGVITVTDASTVSDLSEGQSILVTVNALDSNGNNQQQVITIEITKNHPPTLDYNFLIFPTLTSPVAEDDVLIEIGTLGAAINDIEGDDVEISIDGGITKDGDLVAETSFSTIFGILSSPYDVKTKILSRVSFNPSGQNIIANPPPADDGVAYTKNISFNFDNSSGTTANKFFIKESAPPNTAVRNDISGLGGDEGRATYSHGSGPAAETYNYSIILTDDAGFSSTFPDPSNPNHVQFIEVNHTQSVASRFSISTNSSTSELLLIDNNGIIKTGENFPGNLTAPDSITFTVTVENSYGHEISSPIFPQTFQVVLTTNLPPTFDVVQSTTHDFQVNIAPNEDLLRIINITDPENDDIASVSVSIISPLGESVSQIETTISNGGSFPMSAINYSNDIIVSCGNTIEISGIYTYSITLTDSNGNESEERTGTFEVFPEDDKVYFYKWGIMDGVSEIPANIDEAKALFGLNVDGTVISAGGGNFANSLVNNLINSPLGESFTPDFALFPFPQFPVEFITEIPLSQLDDFDGTTVTDGTGISQLGERNYNSQALLIVFPMGTSGAPTSMYNGSIDGLNDDEFVEITDRYYLLNIGDTNAIALSNVITFNNNSGNTFGILFTRGKMSGTNKFYLIPDEFSTLSTLNSLT